MAIGERTIERDRVQTITRRTRKDGSLIDVELLVGAPHRRRPGRGHARRLSRHHRSEPPAGSLFEAMLEVSPEAIALIDLDDPVTSWNPAAERLFGYSADEAVGEDINELVAGRGDLFDRGRGRSTDAGQGETVHLLTQRTQEGRVARRRRHRGRAAHRRRRGRGEARLLPRRHRAPEQKRYFQSLLDLSPAAIAVTDLESKVVSWSPGAEKVFGYTAEEAIGSHLDDLVANDPALHQEAAQPSAGGRPGSGSRSPKSEPGRTAHLVDVQIFSEPVVVNEKRVGAVVIYHDITEVQQQKRYFESLLEISPTAVAIVDLDERSSRGTRRPSGSSATAEEAIGRKIDDLVATRPELHDEAVRLHAGAARGELVQAVTQRNRTDGSLVDVELLIAPVAVARSGSASLVIYHDISEVQQQQR